MAPGPVLCLLALNPLVLTTVVSGAHNDVLMVALVLAGFWLHDRHRDAAAMVVLVLAAEVKIVAVVAVGALLVQILRTHGWRRATTLGGVSAGILVAATTILGLPLRRGLWGGWGWVHAMGVPGRSVTALTPIDALWYFVRSRTPSGDPQRTPSWRDPLLGDLRLVTLLLALLVCAVLLLRRAPADPLATTAVIFGIVTVTGPVLWPWYFVWPLALISIAGTARQVTALVAVSTASLFAIAPGGPVRWGRAHSLPSPAIANAITLACAVALCLTLVVGPGRLVPHRLRVRLSLAPARAVEAC